MPSRTSLRLLATATVALYFLWFTRDGFTAFFTNDDLMNLLYIHEVWEKPWPVAVRELLLPGGAMRPAGGLYYRAVCAVAGMDAPTYRVLCYCLLTVNIILAWMLARRLSGSERAAWFTALVFCFHPAFAELYCNTGTIYEILCVGFYLSAVLCFIEPGELTRVRWAGLAISTVLASQSKEMAVTLPAALAWYMVSYRRVRDRQLQYAWLLVTVLVAVYVGAKVLTESPLRNNPLYQPHWSISYMLSSAAHYADIALLQAGAVTPAILLAGAAMLAVVARVLNMPSLWFSWGWSMVTVLPVLVVAPRAGFVLYLPWFGVSNYVGSLLAKPTRGRLPAAGVAVVLMLLLAAAYGRPARINAEGELQRQRPLAHFWNDFHRQHPTLPAGARLLFRRDPFPPQDITMPAMLQLGYRDPSLAVVRAVNLNQQLDPDQLALFYLILDCDGSGCREQVRQTPAVSPWTPSTQPVQVVFDPPVQRPGGTFTVRVPQSSAQIVDVKYRLQQGAASSTGTVWNWCVLDREGKASLQVPAGHPIATVHIVAIRTNGGPWWPAFGSLQVR